MQRRDTDGAWETVQAVTVRRSARTRLDVPAESPGGDASRAFRVVFVPKNADIPSWRSEAIRA